MPPSTKPSIGIIRSFTKDVTIFENAPPITTAKAKSKIFPLRANCLNSFNIH